MTFGEQAYLALVLGTFFAFAIILATVARETNRWSRERSAADERHRLQSFDKAALKQRPTEADEEARLT